MRDLQFPLRLFSALATIVVLVLCQACAAVAPGESSPGDDKLFTAVGAGLVNQAPEVAETRAARAVGALELNFRLPGRNLPGRSAGWVEGRSFCTATLVAPNVVLTAAHCVSYIPRCIESESSSTCEVEGMPVRLNGIFRLEQSCHEYRVAEVRSWGKNGEHDLALVRLASAVPDSLAEPVSIAAGYPEDGAPLRTFGYGHAVAKSATSGFRCGGFKRYADARFDARAKRPADEEGGHVRYLLPGDSGGPTIGPDGGILLVTSGFSPVFCGEEEGQFRGCDASFAKAYRADRHWLRQLEPEIAELSEMPTEPATCDAPDEPLGEARTVAACLEGEGPTCDDARGITIRAKPSTGVYSDDHSQWMGWTDAGCDDGEARRCLCTDRGFVCDEDALCTRASEMASE